MAIAIKALRFDYHSVNSKTGLTDVKGQVFVAGVAKAVGASALLFSEVDSTNAKGLYSLLITPAQLTSWGVVAGGENTVEVFTNSAVWPGPTPIKSVAQVATADDIAALIGAPSSPAGTVVGDIALLSTKIGTPSAASVSADIASLATTQSTILSQVQALANAATIAGGASFILPSARTSGVANTLLVPITIQDNDGDLVDPSGGVIVGLKNQAGVDRGAYITGASGTPATVSATKNSVGQYQVTVIIPANAPQEELIASFSYTILGKPYVRFGVMAVNSDLSTAAQQTTLADVQTTVNAINTAITSASFGLNALKNILSDATSGLPALQGLLSNGTYGLNALYSILSNSTYGLAQLATNVATANTALTNLAAQLTSTQGAGFDTTKHSLSALGAAIALIPISGGRGV